MSRWSIPVSSAGRLPLALGMLAAWSLGTAHAADSAATDKLRVQLTAKHAVTISAELAANIAAIPVQEGSAFRQGQPLVQFECSAYRAQLRKAEASQEAARQTLKTNQRLAELNSASKLDVELAQARVKEAEAEVAFVQTTVSKCVIAAPFSGRVAARKAAAFQYVSPGTPLLDILDTSQLELKMIVPSKWLTWIKPGASLQVTVDELGRSFPATIVRLGAQIDPVSQTVLAIGLVKGNDPALLPGMSGWATFDKPGGK